MKLLKHRIIGDKQRINQLKIMLSIFFICLLIPLTLVIHYVFQQLETDMEFQYQWKSVNVLKQINKKLNHRVKIERKRPVSHYDFYQVVTNPLTGTLTKELSPLSNPDNYPEDIGLLGYFQIDSNKILSSPLLPFQTRKQIKEANTDLQWQEIERRIAVKERLAAILLENDFSIKLENAKPKNAAQISKNLKVELFQVKITPDNKLIIFRNYWLNQQHHIQGFIVEKDAYLQSLLSEYFVQGHFESDVQMRLKTIHSDKSNYQYFKYSRDKDQPNVTLLEHSIPELEEKYIYHGYLIAPFQQVQLKFTIDNYHLGSASEVIVFFLMMLIAVIVFGCLGFYWVGKKQIELAEQRMNFVSSVSHELKTPLTSILMYSEMLKSGMVNDTSAQQEYHEFIFSESERLSRLIKNILQLSNLNRQQEVVNLEYVNVLSLKDTIQSKISSLIEKNDFKVNFIIDESFDESAQMMVDLDAFAQIVINLVDNSVKFFNAAKIEGIQRRKIDIGFFPHHKSNKYISFRIRDYGPGISASVHDRIFELFYREGNELTRTTPGTGIGLALVNELAIAQSGQVTVNRKEQGVEFVIQFNGRSAAIN
jgi:signal transduction histidine kinase